MKKNIVIVEDEMIEARVLASLFTQEGFNVQDIIISGEDLIEKLRSGDLKPDLITMDIFLTDDMTGIETTKIINKEFDIPVIYISAYSDHETMQKLNKTEYEGFVLKPYDDDTIIEIVKKILKK